MYVHCLCILYNGFNLISNRNGPLSTYVQYHVDYPVNKDRPIDNTPSRMERAAEVISPWRKLPPFCSWHGKRIFVKENIWISNKIWLKYIPCGQIDSMSALVQIMAWRRPGDKPLSEPMLTQFTDA